jgi:hypothetical protein
MDETTDWQALRAERQAHAEKKIREAAAKDSVSRDFFGAALIAMHSAQQDELHPTINEYGESLYKAQQGIKAACHAREDVAAILMIQQAVLRRLQGLRVLAWACLASLCYIAVRVS